jgi:chromosome segregation ATPase
MIIMGDEVSPEAKMIEELRRKLEELNREREAIQNLIATCENELKQNIAKQEEARATLTKLLEEEKEISKRKAEASVKLAEVNKKIEKLSAVKRDLEELWKV